MLYKYYYSQKYRIFLIKMPVTLSKGAHVEDNNTVVFRSIDRPDGLI